MDEERSWFEFFGGPKDGNRSFFAPGHPELAIGAEVLMYYPHDWSPDAALYRYSIVDGQRRFDYIGPAEE